MKLAELLHIAGRIRRAPHGARGLKRKIAAELGMSPTSRPARGAWIETPVGMLMIHNPASRPARGAWIETVLPEETAKMV